MAAFEVSFSIRKEFKKKKVNREIVFTLISLFHEQIQELVSRSTTSRTFVFHGKSVIAKYLEQKVDSDLSVCVDECSSCGLSINGEIKIYQCHMIKKQ